MKKDFVSFSTGVALPTFSVFFVFELVEPLFPTVPINH